MTLKQYQEEVDRWAQQFATPYWKPHEIYARLGEETGEIGREINHQFGPKKKKPGEPEGDLGEEIADVLFTLICLANSEGIDLDEKMRVVLDQKCGVRDNDRYDKK